MGDLMPTTTAQLIDWMSRFDVLIQEQRGYLTDLDSEVGDGDHGANMSRGLAAVTASLATDPPEFVDELAKSIGMTLVSTVGGASGPLYGTFFLRFGASAGHTTKLTPIELSDALAAGLAGVVERGKPERDDKTMFDAMEPAVLAFRTGIVDGDVTYAATLASHAADAGRDASADLVARKGRASYLGERSVGHVDPGAASTALLFEALAETLGRATA
jgi:dihydroxyacetone kinase-like protein